MSSPVSLSDQRGGTPLSSEKKSRTLAHFEEVLSTLPFLEQPEAPSSEAFLQREHLLQSADRNQVC
jgi:hypothetical protein